MQFPPSAYTERGGVGTVAANAKVIAAREANDPETGEAVEPLAETTKALAEAA
jgi:ParB family chromosome partitioning protein